MLGKLFAFVVVLIVWGMFHNKTAPMTSVHIRYGDIFADVVGDTGQAVCCENRLDVLKRWVKLTKRMLMETFDENCDSGLYTSE